MNLTVQQENSAIRVLKQLVKKSGNMLPDTSLTLWDSKPKGIVWGGNWTALTISRHGLRVESGYKDTCTSLVCECINDHQDRFNRPRKVQPSAKVVREYELTATVLKRLLAKLK